MNEKAIENVVISIVGPEMAVPLLERVKKNSNLLQNLAAEFEREFGPVSGRKILMRTIERLRWQDPGSANLLERILKGEA